MSYRYRYNSSPSLGDMIIAMLFSCRSTKAYHAILNDLGRSREKRRSVDVTLSRLKKKGIISNSSQGWEITRKGVKEFRNKENTGYITSPFSKKDTHNTIVSFDIPERDRKVRNWLRNQLKIFDYEMLQQSLWIGPGPLPRTFFQRLVIFNIRNKVKTFKIKKVKEFLS